MFRDSEKNKYVEIGACQVIISQLLNQSIEYIITKLHITCM